MTLYYNHPTTLYLLHVRLTLKTTVWNYLRRQIPFQPPNPQSQIGCVS